MAHGVSAEETLEDAASSSADSQAPLPVTGRFAAWGAVAVVAATAAVLVSVDVGWVTVVADDRPAHVLPGTQECGSLGQVLVGAHTPDPRLFDPGQGAEWAQQCRARAVPWLVALGVGWVAAAVLIVYGIRRRVEPNLVRLVAVVLIASSVLVVSFQLGQARGQQAAQSSPELAVATHRVLGVGMPEQLGVAMAVAQWREGDERLFGEWATERYLGLLPVECREGVRLRWWGGANPGFHAELGLTSVRVDVFASPRFDDGPPCGLEEYPRYVMASFDTYDAIVRDARSGCPSEVTVGTDATGRAMGSAPTGDDDDCPWTIAEGWVSDFLAGAQP